MKISRILCIAAAALCMTACDEDAQFEKELYKKVINVLSNDDLTFPVYHSLTGEETIGYISINCGGSKHIDHDVVVELEKDNEAIARYNKLNFDIDESKYARELDSRYYDIPDMTTVLKADNADTYSTVPVHVRPDGLSPDSIYLIPLRIKSVSDYETNPKKSTILYRVLLRNAFATQSPTTFYQVRGTDISFKENGVDIDKYSTFSLSRIFVPLSKNTVRCFVGMNTYELSGLTEDAIRRYGMQISINEDATVTLTASGTAQIEMINDNESNYSVKIDTEMFSYCGFALHYRYRVLKDGSDGSNGDADYGIWHEMEETMTGNVLY